MNSTLPVIMSAGVSDLERGVECLNTGCSWSKLEDILVRFVSCSSLEETGWSSNLLGAILIAGGDSGRIVKPRIMDRAQSHSAILPSMLKSFGKCRAQLPLGVLQLSSALVMSDGRVRSGQCRDARGFTL